MEYLVLKIITTGGMTTQINPICQTQACIDVNARMTGFIIFKNWEKHEKLGKNAIRILI